MREPNRPPSRTTSLRCGQNRRPRPTADLEGVAARLGNVFEQVLPPEYGEVFRIKERLRELGALNAAMSGSGPTVFAIFRRREEAERAAAALKGTYAQTYVAEPVKKFAPAE